MHQPDHVLDRTAILFASVIKEPPTIMSFNKNGNRVPIFMFTSLALTPGEYGGLIKTLDYQQPFHVFNPPVIIYSETGRALIDKVVALAYRDLNKICPEGPVIIGGWSAGVTPALDLAQRLRAERRDVPLLIALDKAPENSGVSVAFSGHGNRIRKMWHNSRNLGYRSPLRAFASDVYNKVVERMADKLFGRHATATDNIRTANPKIPEERIQAMARYEAACYDYHPQRYEGRVLLVEATLEPLGGNRQKWNAIAPNVIVRSVRGTHLTIVQGNDADKTGAIINDVLSGFSENYGQRKRDGS